MRPKSGSPRRLVLAFALITTLTAWPASASQDLSTPAGRETVIEEHYTTVAKATGDALRLEVSSFLHLTREEFSNHSWLSLVTPPEGFLIELEETGSSGPIGPRLTGSWSDQPLPPYFSQPDATLVSSLSLRNVIDELTNEDRAWRKVKYVTSFRVQASLGDQQRDHYAIAFWFATERGTSVSYRLLDALIPHIATAIGWIADDDRSRQSAAKPSSLAESQQAEATTSSSQQCVAWEFDLSRGYDFSPPDWVGSYGAQPIPGIPNEALSTPSHNGHLANVTAGFKCKCTESCIARSSPFPVLGSGACVANPNIGTWWRCHRLSPGPGVATRNDLGDSNTRALGTIGWGCAYKVCPFCLCGVTVVAAYNGFALELQLSPFDAVPWKAEYSEYCPACRTRVPVTLRVTGLDLGQHANLNVLPNPGFFPDSEYQRIHGLADGSPVTLPLDYTMVDGSSVRVKFISGSQGISCPRVETTVSGATTIEVQCDCQSSADGEDTCGGGTQTPPGLYQVGGEIDVDTFDGEESEGSVSLELFAYSDQTGALIANEVITVTAHAGPTYFSSLVAEGSQVNLTIRQTGTGMQCGSVVPSSFQISGDTVANIGCTVGPEYWCHLFGNCEGNQCRDEWTFIGEGEIEVTDASGNTETQPVDIFELAGCADNWGEEELGQPVTEGGDPPSTLVGSKVFVRNRSGSTWSGTMEIVGVARDDEDGVSRIRAFLNGNPVPLTNLQINQPDPLTCGEYSTPNCNSNTAFRGHLDTTAFADGVHTLSVVADRGPNTVPGMRNITVVFDNGNGGGTNDAEMFSVNFPSSLDCDQTTTATISVENTGTTQWTSADGYHLFARGGSDPLADSTAIGLPTNITVNPGQIYAFEIPLQAPSTEGTYTSEWRMKQTGVGEFGPVVSRNVTVSCGDPEHDAQPTLISFPSELTCGESATASVRMKNTGTSTWTGPGGFGLHAPSGADPLATTQAIAVDGVVSPNDSDLFTIPLLAPAEAGTYTSHWRMARGSSLFGVKATATVTVTCEGGGGGEDPIDNATVASSTLPTTMACDGSTTAVVTMRNNGTSTWTAANGYRLRAVGGSDPLTNDLEVLLPANLNIAPGQEHDFSIPLEAPGTSGTYRTDWRMFRQGWSEFGGMAVADVTVDCDGGGGGGGDTDAAQLQSETLPGTMGCGTQNANITLKNTGNTTWTRAGGYELRAIGGTDPFTSNTTIRLPSNASIGPDQSHTFQVALTAPGTPGWYLTDWRLHRVGTGGFGPQAIQNVNVTCTDGGGGGTDDATFYDSNLPLSLDCGERVWASIWVKNVGTTTWTKADGYSLQAIGGTDPLANTANIPFPDGVTTGPQDTVEFRRWFEAPMEEDSYLSDWQMKKTGSGTFGSPILLEVEVFCDGEEP
ncbi:MAG: NBR1-Ig-like domain-containing protein [Acidobacteriota bacterium]